MLDVSTDRTRLHRLLHEYNEYPDRRERIVAEIEEYYQRLVAILVLDSCGFSRAVQSLGIVPFLALLERLQRLALPIVEGSGGRLLRWAADNIFAIFPDVTSAVTCAEAICRQAETANVPLPNVEEIYVSIGIGWGEVLVVDDQIYGNEMDLAFLLGEELAQKNEILLTTRAYEGLGDSAWQCEQVPFSISGIELNAYRLIR